MIIYSWGDDLKPGANSTGHQCVNWPKLAGWAEQRMVNIYEPGLVVHPRLGMVAQSWACVFLAMLNAIAKILITGPVYPNGDVDKGMHDT